ncbi:hypothetical protein SAMN05892877_11011 [Rhizobium subbaraonis]|uniref:Sulfotransferase family protein n=1 Tax=Rhizobium subbaraonis TaxID=908946 RepID=A0A285UKT6_9HYPH|nr:hypothetical protein [Rhizobium subbaraonis]SOC42469.1 hypothetical protein SAMN05892877_11011 [Rhizobium subbaraonis]
MILVPELKTIIILVPRTGSGSLRRAIAARYPRSILLYRHMEADGVPAGYDRWQKVGIVRQPVERLWSLYKFLRTFAGDHDSAYVEAMRKSVAMPFDEWIVENRVPFTTPYDSAGYGRFWPEYTVRHPMAENRKSQFMYLRPDLGTDIMQFDDLDAVSRRFDIELPQHNRTDDTSAPELSAAAQDYCERVFAWDFAATMVARLPKLTAAFRAAGAALARGGHMPAIGDGAPAPSSRHYDRDGYCDNPARGY